MNKIEGISANPFFIQSVNELEDSTTIYCSIIEQEEDDIAKTTAKSKKQGDSLIDKMDSIVTAASTLKHAIEFIYSEGTTLGSTGFTISSGLLSLITGNFIVGLPITVIGLNELRKIVDRFNRMTDASGLIGEAKTGVAMIKQLEEFQIHSLKSIDTHISEAAEQLKEAQNQLEDIKAACVSASADAMAKHQQALELTEKAIVDQQQAIHELHKGRSSIETAIVSLNEISEKLEGLIVFAREHKASVEDVELFIQDAQKLLTYLKDTQAGILLASNQTSEGLILMKSAIRSYGDALEKHKEAVQIMQQALYEVQLKAQMKQLENAQKEVQEAREEAAIALERADINRQIAAHAQRLLIEAQGQEADRFGCASWVGGGLIGMIAAPMVSPVLAIPVAGAGVAGVHYVRRVNRLIANFFEKRGQPLHSFHVGAELGSYQVKYDAKSSGWGGYVRDMILQAAKRESVGSRTQGVIAINLGGESPSVYQFNKSSSSELGMMLDGEIRRLDSELRQNLKSHKITFQECLAILDSLERIPSDHGDLCLISQNCIYLEDLRSQCRRENKNL